MESANQRRPRDNVSLWHFVEHFLSIVHLIQLQIHGKQVIACKNIWGRSRPDKLSMDCFAAENGLVLGAILQEGSKRLHDDGYFGIG